MADTDFEVLNLLLKANSKEFVVQLCQEAYTYYSAVSYPDKVILNTANVLGVDRADSVQLFHSLGCLIQYALYVGCSSVASVREIFPGITFMWETDPLMGMSHAECVGLDEEGSEYKLKAYEVTQRIKENKGMSPIIHSLTIVRYSGTDDFHKNLKDLLSKIIAEYLPTWRKSAVDNHVSLPRLTDFDWRVDVKTSSDSISRMSVPTCILSLKTRENVRSGSEVSCDSSVDLELNKETLDTMLDALGKIRDQLDSVVTKK